MPQPEHDFAVDGAGVERGGSLERLAHIWREPQIHRGLVFTHVDKNNLWLLVYNHNHNMSDREVSKQSTGHNMTSETLRIKGAT